MRDKGNRKFWPLFLRAGNPPSNYSAVIQNETVAPFTLDHEYRFRVNGHIPSRRGLYPFDLCAATSANAHVSASLSITSQSSARIPSWFPPWWMK
jgi:hypothetical protein